MEFLALLASFSAWPSKEAAAAAEHHEDSSSACTPTSTHTNPNRGGEAKRGCFKKSLEAPAHDTRIGEGEDNAPPVLVV